ncbi:MAG: DUF559 domain-containing protein [Patescibacteria group bacterium]|jgi:very-short-patch-repair endonuclease
MQEISIKRARQLRKKLTPSEVKMWSLLRNKRFLNYKFYRQFPVGPYITDFCCRSRKLIIEIDGGGHAIQKQSIKDEYRNKYLVKCGFRVMRIWSNELFSNIDGVMEGVLIELQKQ